VVPGAVVTPADPDGPLRPALQTHLRVDVLCVGELVLPLVATGGARHRHHQEKNEKARHRSLTLASSRFSK